MKKLSYIISFTITTLIMITPIAITFKLFCALLSNDYRGVLLLSFSLMLIFTAIYFLGKKDD